MIRKDGLDSKNQRGRYTIRGTDISIIVQGACGPMLYKSLASLREAFPGAEIILSTWKESDVSSIEADRIVLCDDPGFSWADEVAGVPNNVNRQLVSTQNALPYVTRPYTLKTRSDILFHSASLLQYFGKYDRVPSPYFYNRLLICNYYTRNPGVFGTCFHPSDWILFGRTEDVRRYYANLPVMTQEELEWFRNHHKDSVMFTNYICRFTPEQHIFSHVLPKDQTIDFTCYYSYSDSLKQRTEQAFADCFVVLDYQKQLNITFPKYNPNRYLEKHTLISHWKWRALYRHYSQKNFSFLWSAYCMQNMLLCTVSHVRILCIKILAKLNLKEPIKRFLSR